MTDNNWPPPPPAMLLAAKEHTLAALELDAAANRLRRFYNTTTDYAGASFVAIGVNAPHLIGADDLFATTMLSVDIPANAARLLTGDKQTQEATTAALMALPDGPLEAVDGAGLEAMEVVYLHVKGHLGKASAKHSNPWVMASKLCARKRPDLFPVRDNVVCHLLGLQSKSSYRIDWLVFRHLIADAEVSGAIATVRASIESEGRQVIVLDTELLRLLDAALWTSVMMR